jgi:hypothetical protein
MILGKFSQSLLDFLFRQGLRKQQVACGSRKFMRRSEGSNDAVLGELGVDRDIRGSRLGGRAMDFKQFYFITALPRRLAVCLGSCSTPEPPVAIW